MRFALLAIWVVLTASLTLNCQAKVSFDRLGTSFVLPDFLEPSEDLTEVLWQGHRLQFQQFKSPLSITNLIERMAVVFPPGSRLGKIDNILQVSWHINGRSFLLELSSDGSGTSGLFSAIDLTGQNLLVNKEANHSKNYLPEDAKCLFAFQDQSVHSQPAFIRAYSVRRSRSELSFIIANKLQEAGWFIHKRYGASSHSNTWHTAEAMKGHRRLNILLSSDAGETQVLLMEMDNL